MRWSFTGRLSDKHWSHYIFLALGRWVYYIKVFGHLLQGFGFLAGTEGVSCCCRRTFIPSQVNVIPCVCRLTTIQRPRVPTAPIYVYHWFIKASTYTRRARQALSHILRCLIEPALSLGNSHQILDNLWIWLTVRSENTCKYIDTHILQIVVCFSSNWIQEDAAGPVLYKVCGFFFVSLFSLVQWKKPISRLVC